MSVNLGPFQQALKAADGKARQAALRAINQFGAHVLGEAQKLAPIDTGNLKNSDVSVPAELHGDQVTKVIGFNAEYAAAVHERLNVHHNQGQAKYLNKAVMDNQPKLDSFVADRVREALR